MYPDSVGTEFRTVLPWNNGNGSSPPSLFFVFINEDQENRNITVTVQYTEVPDGANRTTQVTVRSGQAVKVIVSVTKAPVTYLCKL